MKITRDIVEQVLVGVQLTRAVYEEVGAARTAIEELVYIEDKIQAWLAGGEGH